MASAYGLDIGTQSVKLVEVDGSPKKWHIARFTRREIPPGSGPEGVAATVGEVLKQGKARRDGLVVALGSRGVVIREMLVPFREPDQIRKVIRFEAEAHLHNYAIEDVVIDFVKIGEVKDQGKVLTFAAPKAAIRERLAMLKAHGADPAHLNLDMAALFTAAKAVGAFNEHPNAVVLDMGAAATNLLFVMGGELKGCRALRTGSEALAKALARDLAIDTDSARKQAEQGDGAPREGDLMSTGLTLETGSLVEGEKTVAEMTSAIVIDRQDDFIVRVHREVTRTLASWPIDAAVTAVYLTGGASLAPGIRERLEERFKKPIIRLPLVADDTAAVPAADIEIANATAGVALGCALEQIGSPGVQLEFRREDLRYTRKFDLVKVALASAVSLAFILLFLLWLHTQNTLRTRQLEFQGIIGILEDNYVTKTRARYDEVLKDMAKKDLGPKTDDLPKDLFQRLSVHEVQTRKMHQHITSEMGFNVQGIPPIRSALALWRDLSERLGEQRLREQLGYLWVDEVRITQKMFSVEGRIGNRGEIDTVVNELGKIDYAEKVSRQESEADSEGRYRLNINGDLKPTAAEKGEPAEKGEQP